MYIHFKKVTVDDALKKLKNAKQRCNFCKVSKCYGNPGLMQMHLAGINQRGNTIPSACKAVSAKVKSEYHLRVRWWLNVEVI